MRHKIHVFNINLISLGGIYTHFACIPIEKISFMSFIFSEYGDIILHCTLFLTHLYADVWVVFVSSLHFSSKEVFGNIQAFLKCHWLCLHLYHVKTWILHRIWVSLSERWTLKFLYEALFSSILLFAFLCVMKFKLSLLPTR